MERVELQPLRPAILNHDNNQPQPTDYAHHKTHKPHHTNTPKRLLSRAIGGGHSSSHGSHASHASHASTPPPAFKNEEWSVVPLTLSGAPAPSRKREERQALDNLRRKVAPAELVKNYQNRKAQQPEEPPPSYQSAGNATGSDVSATTNSDERNDNRPGLLKRILSHRPMSMIVELADVRTAWQDSDFITECLCWHNVYRQRHGSPVLTMSAELCHYAQTWANHLAHTNKFFYRNDRDVGQNLFQRPVNTFQGDVTGQEVSSYWYAAVRQYNYFKEPDILHANVNAGHFTQLVWAATRHFGVGKARSRAGKVIVVANYSPPGNASGLFELNVLTPSPDYCVPGPPVYDFDNNNHDAAASSDSHSH